MTEIGAATVRRAYWIANRFYAPGHDVDDLAQEALIGAVKARRDWQASRGAFSSFEKLCMERAVITVVDKARRRRRGGGESPLELTDTVAAPDTLEDLVAARERLRKVRRSMSMLSRWERVTVIGCAVGMRYDELGPRRSVDNASAKARRKLRKLAA